MPDFKSTVIAGASVCIFGLLCRVHLAEHTEMPVALEHILGVSHVLGAVHGMPHSLSQTCG
jgi:hypothetical protein